VRCRLLIGQKPAHAAEAVNTNDAPCARTVGGSEGATGNVKRNDAPWSAPRASLEGCTGRGCVNRINEAEKQPIEQLLLGIAEGWWEERRQALEAPVATDDGQQIVRR
jgi:hypothetical protein